MAQTVAQVAAPSSNQILLWQTSTGVAPDPLPANVSGGVTSVYRAGTSVDPVPIIIKNEDATNAVYLGGKGVTGASNGTTLPAGASITRNVVGNDSEYVAGGGNAVNVTVEVGRQ
jgi:hypothetical protein